MENRHIFNINFNLNFITASNVSASQLAKNLNEIIETYLNETFKVFTITMPGKPGMPSQDMIYELRDKMEDIR